MSPTVLPYVVAPPGALHYRAEALSAPPHVQGFWAAKARAAGHYAIPADGCVDVVWPEGSSEPFVVGPTDGATQVSLDGSRTYWGVRLVPGGFTAATGCPTQRIAGLTVPAAEFFVADTSGHPMQALRRMVTRTDSPLDASVGALLGASLRASVRDVSVRSGWSERHLRRKVLASVGIAPARLLAMRRVHVAARLALGGSTLATAAHRAGFTDQAHFTRESRRVLGATPARYVRSVQSSRAQAPYGRLP